MLTGELTTALSNVVLSSVSGVLAWKARGRWLSSAFASAGVAAAAGAVFHGFRHLATPAVLVVCWKLVLLGLAVTSAVLVASTVERSSVSRLTRGLVTALVLVKLATTLTFAALGNSVTPAGVDFLLTLFTIGVLEWRRSSTILQAHWSLAGVVLTLLALALQASGFRHGRPFCHNDAFHLLQAAAFGLFFLGLRPAAAARPAVLAP
jgi:hypothetical protein